MYKRQWRKDKIHGFKVGFREWPFVRGTTKRGNNEVRGQGGVGTEVRDEGRDKEVVDQEVRAKQVRDQEVREPGAEGTAGERMRRLGDQEVRVRR